MNPETLKRAVELAGWTTTRLGNQRVKAMVPDGGGYVRDIGYIDEWNVIAALASQLTKQVDAIGGDLGLVQLVSDYHRVTIHDFRDEDGGPQYYDVEYGSNGPNRDENTITAIVEFDNQTGALSK